VENKLEIASKTRQQNAQFVLFREEESADWERTGSSVLLVIRFSQESD